MIPDEHRTQAPVLVTYGGGVNSSAVLIGMVNRGEPIDAVLFSDTGGETPATYRYVSMMSLWLDDHGYPEIQTVRYQTREGVVQTLEENCLAWPRMPSIAYGWKTCSDRWKRRPQEKWMKKWEPAKAAWAAGLQVIKVIGYDADEPQRAAKVRDDKRYRHRYPLLEWDMGRDECVAAIAAEGLPVPGKSSCFFCPSMRKREVLALSVSDPDLMQRALEMERLSNPRGALKGLGRDWSWAALLDADERQQTIFTDPAEPPCGCYDGGE